MLFSRSLAVVLSLSSVISFSVLWDAYINGIIDIKLICGTNKLYWSFANYSLISVNEQIFLYADAVYMKWKLTWIFDNW